MRDHAGEPSLMMKDGMDDHPDTVVGQPEAAPTLRLMALVVDERTLDIGDAVLNTINGPGHLQLVPGSIVRVMIETFKPEGSDLTTSLEILDLTKGKVEGKSSIRAADGGPDLTGKPHPLVGKESSGVTHDEPPLKENEVTIARPAEDVKA